MKQVKIEKYPQDKVVCWDFFLTLLNPVSLFPIEFNNASQYPVAIDGLFWGVEGMLFFKTTKLKGRKVKHTNGETRARKCTLQFWERSVRGYLSIK